MFVYRKFRGGKGPHVAALLVVYVVLGAIWIGVRQISGLPAWSLAGLALIPFVAPAIVDPWLAKAEASAGRRATIRAVAPGSIDGKLPMADQVGLRHAGVHASLADVEYVQRDEHGAVVDAVRTHRRVLIVGPSAMGKSRLALEVVRREYGSRPLWNPPDAQALRRAAEEGLRLHRAIIWLDDIDRFVGAGGLTVAHLDAVAGSNNVVIATIRSGALSGIVDSQQHKPFGWDVPAWFGEPVWLTSWSADEMERVAAVLGGAALEQANEFGLGAYLAGAPGVLSRLRIAETERPVAYAIARAVSDWRRLGLMQPLPLQWLRRLLPSYLALEGDLTVELDWCSERVNHTVSLVQRAEDGLTVPDFVLEHFEALSLAPPVQIWDAALEVGDDEELTNVGVQASAVYGHFDVAEKAFRSSKAARAAANLGMLLMEMGQDHWDEAEGLFRANLESEPAFAAVGLAILLEKRPGGDRAYVPEAEQLYQRAASLGDAVGAYNAGMNALRREPNQDLLDAERYLRMARDLGHRWGAGQLGTLLVAIGRMDEAGPLLLEGVHSSAVRPSDLQAYGEWLHRSGHHDEAIEWVAKAVDAGEKDAAMSLISMLIERRGVDDLSQAEKVAEKWCTRAERGSVLLATDKRQQGIELIEAGIAEDDFDCMYVKASKIAQASPILPPEINKLVRDLLLKAAEGGHVPSANLLGMLLWHIDRDFDASVPWLRKGCEESDPESSLQLAAILLARYDVDEITTDLVEECRVLLTSAMHSSAPDGVRAAAAANLGIVTESHLDDRDEAERLYRYAAKLGRRIAMTNLSALLKERGGWRNRLAAVGWSVRSRFAKEQSYVPWLPHAHIGDGVLVVGDEIFKKGFQGGYQSNVSDSQQPDS